MTSGYLDGLLGPILVFALGMGLLFAPLTVVAVSGVPPHEAGAASSLLNVMQQVGGSLAAPALAVALLVIRPKPSEMETVAVPAGSGREGS